MGIKIFAIIMSYNTKITYTERKITIPMSA